MAVLAICCGACAGALGRWLLSLWLNPILAALPLGTLTVNLAGSFIMGVAMPVFLNLDLNPQWKLLVVTGFLGSFTTFSAFAGEMANLFMAGRYCWLACGIFLHVFGSIALALLGMGCFNFFRALIK